MFLKFRNMIGQLKIIRVDLEDCFIFFWDSFVSGGRGVRDVDVNFLNMLYIQKV